MGKTAQNFLEEVAIMDDVVKYGTKINGMMEILNEGKAHPSLKLLLLKAMVDYAVKEQKKLLSRRVFKEQKNFIKKITKGNLHVKKLISK